MTLLRIVLLTAVLVGLAPGCMSERSVENCRELCRHAGAEGFVVGFVGGRCSCIYDLAPA